MTNPCGPHTWTPTPLPRLPIHDDLVIFRLEASAIAACPFPDVEHEHEISTTRLTDGAVVARHRFGVNDPHTFEHPREGHVTVEYCLGGRT